MNIALIGAPGSGKTDLAEALRNHLSTHVHHEDGVEVIDGYIPEIETETNMALGPFADYLGNLYVALGRYARERVARERFAHVITCGTFIETAIYLALHFMAAGQSWTDEDRREAAPQMDAVLRIFAVLYNDILRYDAAFYLPLNEGDEDARIIDQQIQAGLAGFKLIPVTVLGNHETQLADALKALEVHAA